MKAHTYLFRRAQTNMTAPATNVPSNKYVANAAVQFAEVLASEGQREKAAEALKLALDRPTV